MSEVLLQRMLALYGVQAATIDAAQKGYRNESYRAALPRGRALNLIVYKREPDILAKITNANRVANHLASQGFPARRTVDERILQLRAGGRVQYAVLYHYLPGRTIPWEAYTMAHIKLLGKTMSGMHAALAAMPMPASANVADEYLAILARMQRYFADEMVGKAMRAKLGVRLDRRILPRLQKIVAAARTLPGQHTLHMDFVRGNILFDEFGGEPRITGILDFEKTAVGHPLFDIARTLAFLLVDCKYKTPAQVRKYFLQSGYQKRGAAPFRNVRIAPGQTLLDALTQLFLLHDFYKFLRHNPYEFLHQNEHYRRTVQLLRRQSLITIIAVRQGNDGTQSK